MMRVSAAGRAFIRREEGCILRVYKDALGYPTIGVGHLIRPGEDFSAGITEERADELLTADLAPCEQAIDSLVRVPLTQNKFDALASWLFNCGSGALAGSTLLRRLNDGNYYGVGPALEMWCKGVVDGKRVTIQFLLARRRREADLFYLGSVSSKMSLGHPREEPYQAELAYMVERDRDRALAVLALAQADLARDAMVEIEDIARKERKERDA